MSSKTGSVAQSCCHLCHPWQRTAHHFLHKFRVVPGSHILLLFLCPVLLLSSPSCLAAMSERRKSSRRWSKPPELELVPLTSFQLPSPRELRSFQVITHPQDISGMYQINTISANVLTQTEPQCDYMNLLPGTKGYFLSAVFWYLSVYSAAETRLINSSAKDAVR